VLCGFFAVTIIAIFSGLAYKKGIFRNPDATEVPALSVPLESAGALFVTCPMFERYRFSDATPLNEQGIQVSEQELKEIYNLIQKSNPVKINESDMTPLPTSMVLTFKRDGALIFRCIADSYLYVNEELFELKPERPFIYEYIMDLISSRNLVKKGIKMLTPARQVSEEDEAENERLLKRFESE
jgi:hypothetical protein